MYTQWVSPEEVYLGGAAAVAVLLWSEVCGRLAGALEWQKSIGRERDERGELGRLVFVSF